MVTGRETPSTSWRQRVPLHRADRVQSIAKSQQVPVPKALWVVWKWRGPRAAHTTLTEEKSRALVHDQSHERRRVSG